MMGPRARDTHRQLDRQSAEAEARDREVGKLPGSPDIARPSRYRTDVVSGTQEAKVLLLVKAGSTAYRGGGAKPYQSAEA